MTGGGGGIGRAIALGLAEAGANVVIVDVVPERCEETAARVREAGVRALPYPLDIMDGEGTRTMIAAADTRFGRIDIMVNNAGGVFARPFLEQSERSWQRHIDINLMSMLRCIHASAPIMIRGGRGGAIINVTSIEATRAAPTFAVYAACKVGMVSFTKTMALELSQYKIRVNAIAPDHTTTPGNMGNRTGPVDPSIWPERTAAQEKAWQQLIPLQREGIDTECGDAAVFLASEMSAYITGTTLHVDGGTYAASGWVRDEFGNWTLNQGLHFTPPPSADLTGH